MCICHDLEFDMPRTRHKYIQKNISIPEDFQVALDKNKKAKAFFATMKSSERYSFLFRIHTAKKPETRAKRIQQFVKMLERNEKIYFFKTST